MTHQRGPRRVIILGSTGSIGTQAIEVIRHLNALYERGACESRFEVVGLAAGSNANLLHEQAVSLGVRDLAIHHGSPGSSGVRVRTGPDAPERLVREVECDVIIAAIVGAAGLPATLAGAALGREVALANKETLVAAGELVTSVASRSGSRIFPIDSEHCALWQCLTSEGDPVPPLHVDGRVRRAYLTASGGPFRTWTRERIRSATPEQAMRHPTWTMGPKVTVDSASLMNKALELIEAHWLFGLGPERLGALVHPQSIVHAIAEFRDGSMMAQLAQPDMRGPIQHALSRAHRWEAIVPPLTPQRLARLDFEEPDPERFPALGFAYEVMRRGGTAGAVLNAANEEAVRLFLEQTPGAPMGFGRVIELVRETFDEIETGPAASLEDVREAGANARRHVRRRAGVHAGERVP